MAGKDQTILLDPSEIFRPENLSKDSGWTYRTYDEEKDDPKMKQVYNTYRIMHQNQCVEYVQSRRSHWCQFNKFKATIMEALDRLNEIIDESDPDTDLPNIVHAFQTAEMIRKAHPDLDWFHLTGLIHDLGKVMVLYGEPQWSTVGDTFPVGCQFADSIVFGRASFEGNPDLQNKKFNTKYGIYSPNCGLQNVTMSWGHDEYLYQVLKHNGSTLPQEALNCIRYHSFYPYHSSGDYKYLTDNLDEEMLPWVKEFNKFDLYTKREDVPDMESIKPYYLNLINKYCPGTYEW